MVGCCGGAIGGLVGRLGGVVEVGQVSALCRSKRGRVEGKVEWRGREGSASG